MSFNEKVGHPATVRQTALIKATFEQCSHGGIRSIPGRWVKNGFENETRRHDADELAAEKLNPIPNLTWLGLPGPRSNCENCSKGSKWITKQTVTISSLSRSMVDEPNESHSTQRPHTTPLQLAKICASSVTIIVSAQITKQRKSVTKTAARELRRRFPLNTQPANVDHKRPTLINGTCFCDD